MDNKFYTIEDIAKILGMHHKTVRKFITEGKLAASKVGKQWRISGHDLSVFLENNESKCSAKKLKNEDVVTFSTGDEQVKRLNAKINVSTVIDINDLDMDEYTRISNMLLAVMNCNDDAMKDAKINMNYSKDTERLRIMLWGSVSYIENMLSSVSALIENSDG